MQNVAQLRQSAVVKLNLLPQAKLVEVLNFIDFVRTRPIRPRSLPAPDAFVECAGAWKFEPGELEEILQDIKQSRLMELEERHGELLD